MSVVHLHDELKANPSRVPVTTRYGTVTGGRASTGAAIFLEIPYALPPQRFADPVPLPPEYQYEDREYIQEASYAVQPKNDGQAQDTPFENKVGFGQPTENPLFLNIVSPPSFPARSRFPVKVYIHGGFLQFGSPHHLNSQAQYISAERSEVWVNVGYRLSAFGFLASDQPPLTGNYGFKDQWLALQWVKANIENFGGDPDNIEVSGLSAGAHCVHQLLHHASCQPEDQKAPFRSAFLQSNAILVDPKTPAELREQFRALCHALKLDPDAPDILDTLRDPIKVPWSDITRVIENDTLGVQYGTFRGCLSSDWMTTSPGPIARQRSGQFARSLRARGVRSIVLGDLLDEWYLYSVAHPIQSPKDILPNLKRYFQDDVLASLSECFDSLPDDAKSEDAARVFGEILSSAQVHLPVRLLHLHLYAAGFPVFRYEIHWTPEQLRPEGYVTHGTDRCLWALRKPSLTAEQVEIAQTWLNAFFDKAKAVQGSGSPQEEVYTVLTLGDDKQVQWGKDERWDRFCKILDHLVSRGHIDII
ncbi:hypothetical protein AMATHDRAFT_60152 [Amanita thiersii Skay4041]|uniref:Carboxylic ester hydrolase n=1 Tax=Amanita thiersii Skay4041 TaxID=703135 RepID=A0A2A9NLJ5_9AGAR|nr:hypothetical protein AMATHDRAFT_60152 [Amanita thiersii Skay4041]